MSIDMYSYAYVSDPLVSGFITQSGNVGVLTRETPGSFARWNNVSQAVGCGNSSSSAVTLDCMRKKPVQDLLNAQAKVNLVKAFGPVVDNKTVFSDYEARGSAGNFIKKVCKMFEDFRLEIDVGSSLGPLLIICIISPSSQAVTVTKPSSSASAPAFP